MKSPLISQEPFVPHPYESLDPSDQEKMDLEEYAQYVAWFARCTDVIFERIWYHSDGLRVTGILCRPAQLMPHTRYPVIIYNRGGAGEWGKITVNTLYKRLYPLVKLGYIVIGSQYRGNDGSEGKDQIGGSDINDVFALYPIIQSLEYADTNNLFMIGFSRGAIDTYRVLQKNILPVRASAVMSGASDLISSAQSRPDLLQVLEQFVPQSHTHKKEELTKRSAFYWIEDISVPLLLIHGDADETVAVSVTQHLADRLAQLHKRYKLILYPGADHSLDSCIAQAIKAIDEWFTHYKVNNTTT